MPERKVAYQAYSKGAASGFMLYSPSLERLYIDAALALTDFRLSLDLVRDTERRETQVHGASRLELMQHWLNAILVFFKDEKFLAKRIFFQAFNETSLNAVLFGEPYESPRHGYAKTFKALNKENIQIEMNFESPEPDKLFSLKIIQVNS